MYNATRAKKFGSSKFGRSRTPHTRRGGFGSSRRSFRGNGERIDESRFVKKCEVLSPEKVRIVHTFDDFKFCSQLNRNLLSRNYKLPTPVQDQSISQILSGRDIVGLADTGTGKTAAFLLPLIEKCFSDRLNNVLIIALTRELAQQIDEEFRRFSAGMGLYSAVCVGGMPIYRQISALGRRPDFVIGTPGRLKDLKDRGVIKFSIFNIIVLDEIDRMLDMGFVDEIKRILEELPKTRQSLFFSATIPPKIAELVKQFLNNPISVQVSEGETARNVDQNIVRVPESQKFDRLKDLLVTDELKKVLIFLETKHGVKKLAEDLTRDGFKADSIHGDKRQMQRQRALFRFRENQVQILVATDVAARGLDIDNISHVINYTAPKSYNDYIHRIGRTGRGERLGFALTFVNQEHV